MSTVLKRRDPIQSLRYNLGRGASEMSISIAEAEIARLMSIRRKYAVGKPLKAYAH